MGKFDLFRKLNTINGITPKEIITNNSVKEFDQYIKNAPNRYNIVRYNDILNVEIPCTLQDASFNDKKNGDEKIVCCYNSSDLNVGDIINVDGKTWIIMYEENNTIKSHRTYLVRLTNNFLTFKNSLGKIIKIPSIITNLTLYSDGLKQDKITLLDGKRNVIIPLNEDTKNIFVQQRFIFNHNNVFSISLIDDFTTNGLLKLTMIQEGFSDKDDKVNNLAYNKLNSPIVIETDDSYSSVGLISGNDSIKRTKTCLYSCNSGNFSFTLDYNGLPTSSVIMTVIDGNNVKLKNNTEDATIILKALNLVSGISAEKTIQLKGIYE